LGGACTKNGLNRELVPNFTNLERKKLLGGSRHRWEDAAAMDHKEMEDKNVKWIRLAEVQFSGRFLCTL
jgi:hypothetical protein